MRYVHTRLPEASTLTYPFRIVVDTREQQPLEFGEWPVVRAGLSTGDYSIEGYETRFALERKSLPDLFACVGRERDRFERELARLSQMDYAGLVIEADLQGLLNGYERSMVTPGAAVGSLVAWSVGHGLPVWLAHDRGHASELILSLSRKWYRYWVAEPRKLNRRSML
jgi:ERCC4-type nuclease